MTYEEAYKIHKDFFDKIRTTLYHHELGVIPQGLAITQVDRAVKELDDQLKATFEQAKGASID